MPTEPELTDDLSDIAALISEAKEVSDFLATQNPSPQRVKELSTQAARDLSNARDRVENVIDGLDGRRKPSN